LSRLLSNRGEVLVRGRRAPMVGRVSMDLAIVDVTDVSGVALGDEAVLIGEQSAGEQGAGEQGSDKITAYDLADLAGTIPYEVLCDIGARVARVTMNSSGGHV
jgi:alanine racemase